MKDKGEGPNVKKILLGAALAVAGAVFAVVVIGTSFALWWYAIELSAIKQNHLELQGAIDRMQTDTRQLAAQVADISQMIERVSSDSSLEVISVEPPSPATLNPGEKLNVKFRYRLVSAKTAQIWARPYTRGYRTPGYKAHGSPLYKKSVAEAGVAQGWFSFDEPTVVDEIRIDMRDVATGKDVDTISYKIDARWVGTAAVGKASSRAKPTACNVCRLDRPSRISIDVNNPSGQAGWTDEYVIELKPVHDTPRQFGVNWFRPHRVARMSTKKPNFIHVLPKFRYQMQRYLTLRLGDADNNQVVGVMDFRKPDRNHFPFDLYLDKDRDGNLAEDSIENRRHIEGIHTCYRDGTTENYALHLYSYSTSSEPVGVAYQSLSGRYGILEANKKLMQVLVIDNSGNAVFNDDDDAILLDWDLDGRLDGRHQADEDQPLYSALELPGGTYKVAEFDPAGRKMIIRRQNPR